METHTRLQVRGGERRLVRRIRIELGFEAQRLVADGIDAAGELHAGRDIIAGIELYTGQIGVCFHDAAALRIIHFREFAQPSAAERIIVVITAAFFQESVVCANVLADRFRLAEIKRGSVNRNDFSGRNQLVVGSSIAVSVEHQNMIEHVGAEISAEIEIAVVCQINGCLFIGNSRIVQMKSVFAVQRIDDRHGQRSGIAFLTVRRSVAEGDRGLLTVIGRDNVPDNLMETARATVKGVVSFIFG